LLLCFLLFDLWHV